MGTTIGGAGRLHGDVTARCAELLAKVFEAFGKPVGRDDFRSQGQRNHDALETALGMSLGAPDVPQSAGMKTQALVVVSLADLIAMDGGSVLAQQWLAVQDDKIRTATVTLYGAEAEATACAAHVTPVVTGTPDWDVISDMADVFLGAHGISHALSREARLALERTLLTMSIRALSGPGGLAGFLRASLLGRPFSGASVPLDLGETDYIPDYLRRAVILRDRKCQWPGGCDRPASQCEPHHLWPRGEGGETSLENLGIMPRTPPPLHPPPRLEGHPPPRRGPHRHLTPRQGHPKPRARKPGTTRRHRATEKHRAAWLAPATAHRFRDTCWQAPGTGNRPVTSPLRATSTT